MNTHKPEIYFPNLKIKKMISYSLQIKAVFFLFLSETITFFLFLISFEKFNSIQYLTFLHIGHNTRKTYVLNIMQFFTIRNNTLSRKFLKVILELHIAFIKTKNVATIMPVSCFTCRDFDFRLGKASSTFDPINVYKIIVNFLFELDNQVSPQAHSLTVRYEFQTSTHCIK